jgi:2-methylcitrate dehydratase
METQEPGVRIIDKTGPLNNFADRDHCLQYMAAVGLIFGELTAEHYTDAIAADSRIDEIRAKMVVKENEAFTVDYYDLEKRAIGNSIQVHFADGTSTERVEVQYPIGHRNRRKEGIPVLKTKFANSLNEVFGSDQSDSILDVFADGASLDKMPANEFLDAFVKERADIGQMLV